MERKTEENWHIVGVIPQTVAQQIGLGEKTPVWISDKIVRHIDDRHGLEMRRMKTTPLAFVHSVLASFNSVYRQKDGTLLLALEGTNTAMVTYIKLELSTQNYWRVKSAHVRKLSEIGAYQCLWTKKRPASQR